MHSFESMQSLTVLLSAKNMPVYQWSITLHGPDVVLSQFDSEETELVVGTEEAADVLRLEGEGVAAGEGCFTLGPETREYGGELHRARKTSADCSTLTDLSRPLNFQSF